MAVSANRLELLQIADAVAREKSIDKRIVIDAMADAIQKAARSRYGQETNIRADINPTTGDMKLQRLMEVVETVEDCEEVSRAVSPALDVEDPIDKAYHLEVSSPGIDRPLVRKADFLTWVGHQVRMETSILVAERKRFKGTIAEAGENDVLIERDAPPSGGEPTVRVPYEAIAEARLVLTDDLIRDALSRDNQARKEARKRRGEPEEAVGEDETGTQDQASPAGAGQGD